MELGRGQKLRERGWFRAEWTRAETPGGETDRHGARARRAGQPGNGCLTLNQVSLRAEGEKTRRDERPKPGREGVHIGMEEIRDNGSRTVTSTASEWYQQPGRFLQVHSKQEFSSKTASVRPQPRRRP